MKLRPKPIYILDSKILYNFECDNYSHQRIDLSTLSSNFFKFSLPVPRYSMGNFIELPGNQFFVITNSNDCVTEFAYIFTSDSTYREIPVHLEISDLFGTYSNGFVYLFGIKNYYSCE